MKEKRAFSDDVGSVVQSSQRQARRLGHKWLEAEHLLLGILAQSDSMAAELLHRLGCDFSELQRVVEDAIQPSQRIAPDSTGMPLTKEAERILRNTYTEADKSGREQIGTEHILLSLLQDKEVARAVERACGITYKHVREEL